MKGIVTFALISLFILCGCGGADPAAVESLEQKVSSLEERVRTLEDNLQQTRLDLVAKQNEVDKLVEDLRTVATIVDKNSVRIDRVER